MRGWLRTLTVAALAAGCGRTALDVGTDAAVPVCEWSVGRAIELQSGLRVPVAHGAVVRADADLAMVVVTDHGLPTTPSVAVEVSLDEERVVERMAWPEERRGLLGARGGWMTQVREEDEWFFQRLDGSMRTRLGSVRRGFSQTPTSFDSVRVSLEGIDVLSVVHDGSGSYSTERARDPILIHEPAVTRVAPGEWVVVGEQFGIPGAARIGAGPAEFVPIGLVGIWDFRTVWAGDSHRFVMWEESAAGPSGVGMLDLETLTIEAWDMPFPRPNLNGVGAWAARSDILYLSGGRYPPAIAIRRGEATTVLELGELTSPPLTNFRIFGQSGSDAGGIVWEDHDSAWLAPLRCE